MDEIKVTHEPHMHVAWFLEFLDMIVECNRNRRITIVDSDFLIRAYATGVNGYVYRGVHISHALFIHELSQWCIARQMDRERETRAYAGRTS